jgi:DNA-binding NarL/FixJ family response regulator
MGETTLLLVSRGGSPGHRLRPARRSGRAPVEPHPLADGPSGGSIVDQVPPVTQNPLTRREQEVVRAVVLGARTAEAARLLGISNKTVETHLDNIYRKLEIHSRRELAGQALRLGIV